jgi:pimeloyl-ACP methyl ester carboxylesterase
MTDPREAAAIAGGCATLSRNPACCNLARNRRFCRKATRIIVDSQRPVDDDGRVEYLLFGERMPRIHASARKIRRGIATPAIPANSSKRLPQAPISDVNPKLTGLCLKPDGRMILTQQIKNVVLVHGAFADGSGWKRVADLLKSDGYKVSVAQPPETSYADDQKYTKAAIDAMGGPVVLVGHSYGGSIITEAGNHPNVKALVYIAAFALDEGESCASIEQAVPQASTAFKPDSNGLWWIDEAHFVADFAADIPRDEAEFMATAQVPISTDSFTHQVRNPAWKHKPTWYMVASHDRSINPEQERMMAKRAKAKTVEVNSSHVAYMSHPGETAKLIAEAAAGANQ